MKLVNILGLINLFTRCVSSEKLIIQLSPNITFNEFENKYNTFFKTSNIGKYQIGEVKVLTGDFNINLQKSIYFDKSVLSININSNIEICSAINTENNDNNNDNVKIQNFAPKHLVRLSQLNPIKKRQKLDFQYQMSKPVNVYILDTGINSNHPDFTNRVSLKSSLIVESNIKNKNNQGASPLVLQSSSLNAPDIINTDNNGHGTAIASVVGSHLLGVCKNCNLISYQVLNELGIGDLENLVISLEKIYNSEKRGVILMPFITEKSKMLNDVLHEFKVSNFTLVAPAGNFNDDACKYSPSSSNDVLTVGSIDSRTDTIAKFSNFGPCVDIFTDGVNILTLSDDDDDLLKFRSGTSLSSGITAGLMATFLGLNDQIDAGVNNDAIQKINNLAIANKIKPLEFFKNSKTPNKILYNYAGNLKKNL